jgi:hypothetical protein
MTEQSKKTYFFLAALFVMFGFLQFMMYPTTLLFFPMWGVFVIVALLIILVKKVRGQRRRLLLGFSSSLSIAFLIGVYTWRQEPIVTDWIPALFVLYFITLIAMFVVAAYYPNRRNHS